MGTVQLSFAQKSKKKDKTRINVPKPNQDDRPTLKELSVDEMFIQANKAKVLGDIDAAEILFTKLLKKQPKNPVLFYELSRISLAKGNSELAIEQVKTAFDLDSKNKWYGLYYAELLDKNGEHLQAAEVYETILENEPQDVELMMDQAYFYAKAGERHKSVEKLDDVEKILGVSEEISMQKKFLYLQLDEVDKAANEVKKLIATNPKEVNYYIELAFVYKANGRNEEAQQYYEKVLELEPDNAKANLALAESYKLAGEEDKYFEALENIFKNPKSNIDTKVQILLPYIEEVYRGGGNKEQIVRLSQLMTEAHPKDAKAHAMYADMLYQSGENDKALAAYEKTLSLDGSRFAVWQQILFIHQEAGNNDMLAQKSEEVIELFPNQAIPYYLNGLAQNGLKKHETAIEMLDQAELLAFDNIPLKAQVNSTKGEAYKALKRHSESDEAFEQALKLSPENAYIMNNYSYYLSLRGDKLERAKELSLLSNELLPDNSNFQDTYGWILYKTKDYKEALEWLEKANETGQQKSAVVLEHIGDTYFQLNKEDKAVEYWKQALEKGGEVEKLNKKIADKKLYE